MLTKKPLLPGDSEIDQLYKIFQFLGTPNEELWPGLSALPGTFFNHVFDDHSSLLEYQPVFPVWKRKNIGHEIGLPNNSDAVILIEKVNREICEEIQ